MINFKNKQAENLIITSLQHARAKHPYFTDNLQHALLLAQEELGEAIKAYNNHLEKIKDHCNYSSMDVLTELAHCAAVIIRTLDLEYVKEVDYEGKGIDCKAGND